MNDKKKTPDTNRGKHVNNQMKAPRGYQQGQTKAIPHTQVRSGSSGNSRIVSPLNSYSAEETRAKLKKPFYKQVPFIVVLAIVVVLAAVYAGGALFFSSHYFPNTTLNNDDVSMQPADTLSNTIQDLVQNYSLTVEGEGFTYQFVKEDMSPNIDSQKIADDVVKSQNVALWPIEMFRDHDISGVLVATYDEADFSETLKDAVNTFNENQDPSKNATITYDDTAGTFKLVEEVYGTQLDVDKVVAKTGEAIKAMRTSCDLTDDDLIKPVVTINDSRTTEALNKAKELFSNDVTLTLNNSVTAATIDKPTIAKWLYIDPSDFAPKLDQDALTEWVSNATSGLNTVGSTRTWTREDGKVCTVSGGTYGWKVDTSSLGQTVYDTLSAGGATSIDIPCSQTGGQYNGAGKRDWGAYVDIDLTEQTARYYDENGTLLHSCGIVSGLPKDGRDTPTGVYYLNSKASPQVLTGYNSKGEIEYETPVQYWMPFIGNSIGLHDATWQSSFGGTRYKTNGSHGCVNLSLNDAKWFYENLGTGVCVITHN